MSAPLESRIFVSYRRGQDDDFVVGRLVDELRREFGEKTVFQDVTSIKPGADFADTLERALEHCVAALVVIGPAWLAVGKDGHRRLDDPDDWVAHEVAQCLQHPNIRVFPLLIRGAEMPTRANLPETLWPLIRRQAFPLSASYWQNDLGKLKQVLHTALEEGASESQESEPRAMLDERSRLERSPEPNTSVVQPASQEHPLSPTRSVPSVADDPAKDTTHQRRFSFKALVAGIILFAMLAGATYFKFRDSETSVHTSPAIASAGSTGGNSAPDAKTTADTPKSSDATAAAPNGSERSTQGDARDDMPRRSLTPEEMAKVAPSQDSAQADTKDSLATGSNVRGLLVDSTGTQDCSANRGSFGDQAAIRKAAEAGDPAAQLCLGHAYWEGAGVGRNDAEAVKWFRKSAEAGNSWAQVALGQAYAAGRGVAKDQNLALKWFKKANAQGNFAAYMELHPLPPSK